ncbi:MAG: hypothetical protein DRI73_09180 [Bacteroidetes bacterium]|nr:MAG: hypothetical protein DRI73_09180 [Bacteroidota bacterium]
MISRINIGFLTIFLLLSGCEYEFPEIIEDYNSGSTNVANYVGIGDNFSAGFMDGALFTDGQQNSLPAIMAVEFELAGLTNFSQPDISSMNGFNPLVPDATKTYGRWVYAFTNEDQTEPERILTNGETPLPFSGELNAPGNFAVPFARCFDFDKPEFSNNLYYKRFASNPGNSTLIGDILATNPSFFTLWIGIYDYMVFAINGGTGNPNPPSDPSQVGTIDLTPADLFNTELQTILSILLENHDRKGLIAELPMVDDFPFFYTLPYNFMTLIGSALGVARASYKSFNEAVALHNSKNPDDKRPYIDFNDNGGTPYPQPLVVVDNTLADAFYTDGVTPLPKYRQLQEGELLLLSLPVEKVEYGLGSIIPVEDTLYLSLDQIEVIKTRISAFNAIIEQEAAKYPNQLFVVHLTELIHQIAETGKYDAWGRPPSTEIYQYNGVPLSGDLGLNSIFSLDGLQFNQRGNAFIANRFLQTMNDQFSSNLPEINLNAFVGNTVQR